MANTTNLDLVKPAGTDQALISVLNGNSDKIDQFAGDTNTSLESLADGLAIVANGDTHGAISSGQYVYVRNHTTLAEGLYTATSAIAANASLSTSNLTADSDGGFNSLSQAIAKLNSNVNRTSDILTDALNCTATTFFYGSGSSSYTGAVPSNNYKSGTFIVNVRDMSRSIVAYSAASEIAVNTYFNSQWSGWNEYVKKSDLKSELKIVQVSQYVGALNAGASGYISIDLSSTLPTGAVIISCDIGLGHLASKMMVNGTVAGTARTLYIAYYAPASVTQANSDVVVNITYIL